MKRLALIGGLLGSAPLWAIGIGDTIEVRLPVMRFTFEWDKYPTKAVIVDTADGTYIAVFRKNLYPFRIIENIGFRDFPPTGWEADSSWFSKLIIYSGDIYYPLIRYTYDNFTGASDVKTITIPLVKTHTWDTIYVTYTLNALNSTDTVKFLVAKSSDTTCWDLAGTITSADISTSMSLKYFPIPSGACGITDSDTVYVKISFVDNSNVPLDTTKFFAIYEFSVGGRIYRPRPQDTLSASDVNAIVNNIKIAWRGVKNAINSFVGVSESDLVNRDDIPGVLILVGPYFISNPDTARMTIAPADLQRKWPLLGFYDPIDINGREIIYLNTSYRLDTTYLRDTLYLRKWLAFQYARYVAYSIDTSEVDTTSFYPLYLMNMGVTVKACWIAHKAMIAAFDPDTLYSYARGIFNNSFPDVYEEFSFAIGTEATYLFYTALLYDGRHPNPGDIAKFTLWMLYLEELTSEDAVRNAIREEGILFMYLPVEPTSILVSSVQNLISSAGKTYYEAYEEFVMKVFSAGRPYIQRIPGFPVFSNPLLKNTRLTSDPGGLQLKANPLLLFSTNVFGFAVGSNAFTFDGYDGNFIGDTMSGYKVYVIDTVSNTFNELTLDERNRGVYWGVPTFVMIINYGTSGDYVAGNKDTTDDRVRPVVLEKFMVEPNYVFNRYVDVYVITDTLAYYDANEEGAKVILYPATDSADYGSSIVTLSPIAPKLYGSNVYLLFKDIYDRPYYGSIVYKIYRMQSFAGLDYRTATGVSDSGIIQSIKLGRELVEAYPGKLYMRSLSSEKDLLVFNYGKEFAFSLPVDAEIRAKADMGDKVFVFDGVEWREVESYYDADNGEIVAYISGGYKIYVGKDKPSSSPAVFKAYAEIGRIRVIVPYETDIHLIIYGLSGRKVKEYSLKKVPAGGYEFNVSNLPKGVYMVKVKTAKHSAVLKVIGGVK